MRKLVTGNLQTLYYTPYSNNKKAGNLSKIKVSHIFNYCGRWDLNPHERNAHKILSLARLPVPTLPHFLRHKRYNIITTQISQYLIFIFVPLFFLKLFFLLPALPSLVSGLLQFFQRFGKPFGIHSRISLD